MTAIILTLIILCAVFVIYVGATFSTAHRIYLESEFELFKDGNGMYFWKYKNRRTFGYWLKYKTYSVYDGEDRVGLFRNKESALRTLGDIKAAEQTRIATTQETKVDY